MLERKKTDSELQELFQNNLKEFSEYNIGEVLYYSSNGFELYKIIGFGENESGVPFIKTELLYSVYDVKGEKEIYASSIGYYDKLGVDFDISTFDNDVQGILQGKINIRDIGARLEPINESNSTELMTLNKNVLTNKKEHLVKVSNYINAVSERAKAELQSKLSGLYTMVDGFKKTIKKIGKLIFTIELYEGISEEIHQLKVGQNASDSIPLSIRQKKLYMDEEVGDPTDDGLDFQNIEDFDNWLFERNSYWNCYNYEFIIPEEKCVVALGIRREDKNYSSNPFLNMKINDQNKLCYLLIRNGENIYRIYSDLRIGDKMFPEKMELMELQNSYETEKWESERDKIDDKINRYKYNIILLQGIIERTECFPNEQYNVSLFKVDNGEAVNFIYDADKSNLLPSGIKSFSQWVKDKNIGTDVGSQILWFSSSIGFKKETGRMFKEFHYYPEQYPSNPTTGVYQLEGVKFKGYYEKEERDRLFFKFDPNRYSYLEDGYKPRVKRVSFLFEDNDDYINYDNITREDLPILEYYLHTRINRSAYLSNIPILLDILKKKQEEFKKEDDFIKLSLTTSGLNPVNDFDKGVEILHWWKVKNKWKRTLSTDDVKALRMVVKELKKK